MRRRPVAFAIWLPIIFVIGVFVFIVCNRDESEIVMRSILALPWIVGPAAAAMILVELSRSKTEAWIFFGAEVALAFSTVALWIFLTIERDAQNGIVAMFFPIVQFAVLLPYMFAVFAVARYLRRRHARP